MNLIAPTQPVSGAHNRAREAWVDMQLAGAFMRQARPAAYASALMLLAMVAILYGYVEPAGLGLWAVAVVAVTLVRQLVIAFYQRKLQGVSGPALHAFMARCAWI